jgi:hypothetical protein
MFYCSPIKWLKIKSYLPGKTSAQITVRNTKMLARIA